MAPSGATAHFSPIFPLTMNDSTQPAAPVSAASETSSATSTETPRATAPAPAASQRPGHAGRRKGNASPAASPRQRHPLLQTLAERFPAVFGAQPLPLKVGIFSDLQLALDGEDEAALKLALAQHTRSNAYLQAVASGKPRHNLQGEVVEAMAPAHVFHALTELLRRRLRRAANAAAGAPASGARRRDDGDVAAQWQWFERRLSQAITQSGLPATVFAEAASTRDAQVRAVLERVVEQLSALAAREEAMLAAYEATGGTVADFADTYGLSTQEAGLMLARARLRRDAAASAVHAPAAAT